MGIVNTTPDSFYPGSRFAFPDEAVRRGVAMVEEGADIIDVGGESTRPGADAVSEEEERRRVLPVIEALSRRVHVPISVDTRNPQTARRARDAGASILNDVTALRGDPAMMEVALGYPQVILMHMQGEPKTMQLRPRYQDVVGEILSFFEERAAAFLRAGGREDRLLLDPGIGFGKEVRHNLDILQNLEQFKILDKPIVLGASRKAFIGRLSAGEKAPLDVEHRLEGSLAVACRAALAGVSILRVHDVQSTRRALAVFGAVCSRGPASGLAAAWEKTEPVGCGKHG